MSTDAPPDARPDPRVRELAPFLAAIGENPEDRAPRLVFCDRLDELDHPVAGQARALAAGEAGPFLALFAYAWLSRPNEQTTITCPLTREWWPVAVFSDGAAPESIVPLTGDGMAFAMAWNAGVEFRLARADALGGRCIQEWHTPMASPYDWRPPLGGIANDGWLVLWARDRVADRLSVRVQTAGEDPRART